MSTTGFEKETVNEQLALGTGLASCTSASIQRKTLTMGLVTMSHLGTPGRSKSSTIKDQLTAWTILPS